VDTGGNLTLGATGASGQLVLRGNIQESINGYNGDGGINVLRGELTLNSGGLIKRCFNSSGGGVYVDTNGSLKLKGGEISGNRAEKGGGVYISENGSLTMDSGRITDNTADMGGGIYTTDFSNITIGADVSFSGNTAGQPYWLEDYLDADIYNPGVKITVGALKARHNGTNLPAVGATGGLSSPPQGVTSLNSKLTAFGYLANNFDLNFVVPAGGFVLPVLFSTPELISFGTGTIPVRRTTFGLNGSTSYSSLTNHVINEGASNAAGLKFEVMYPKADSWNLELNCTPFKINGRPGVSCANAIAVNCKGEISPVSFAKDQSVTMYNKQSFLADIDNGKAQYDNDSNIGSWNWASLNYDIKVEANPGDYRDNEKHESTFTWSLVFGP